MRIRLFNLFLVFAFIAVVISSSSCKKTTAQAERDLEQEYLSKYVAKYLHGVTPKSSGLYFLETKAGTTNPKDTAKIKKGDLVKVFYGGHLIQDTTGVIGIKTIPFDSSGVYEPFTFTVGAGTVIAGWDEAMTYMKDNSEAKLVIPSKLAYAGMAQSTIPAYSPLVFFIKVYKVYRSTDTVQTIQKLPRNIN
jgi:FKBP-type peptidyl-prolyl cis-trans isomerase